MLGQLHGDIEAVKHGNVEIQDDQVRLVTADEIQCCFTIRSGRDDVEFER